MKVQRTDYGEVGDYEITPEGYLRSRATIARIGIQTYYNEDGSPRRELRLPEEVANPDSLASFGMKALTNDHPDTWLDAYNTKEYQIGTTDSTVTYDYGFVKVNVNITDGDAIQDIKEGKRELSAGYECNLDFTPGEWRGQKYDAIQRNIRANHVSLVDKGRAGPEARIHIDEKLDTKTMTVEADKKEKTPRTDALQQRVSDLEARVSDRDDQITALKTDLEEAQAALKAAQGEALVAKTDLEEYKKQSDSAIAQQVTDRIDTWMRARPYLPKGLAEKMDASMSADALKIAAIENTNSGVKLDGKSSEYIDGMFEAMIASGVKKDKKNRMTKTMQAVEGAYKAGGDGGNYRNKAMQEDDKLWMTTN